MKTNLLTALILLLCGYSLTAAHTKGVKANHLSSEGGKEEKRTILMPTTDEVVSVTTGDAQFYDDGGADEDYSSECDSYLTMYPETADSKIKVSFSDFDTEDENYDYLVVYDGSSSESPQIGKYFKDNTPATITSSAADGSLTFGFTSDGSVTKRGWEASVTNYIPAPMTYDEIACAHSTTDAASVGAKNQQMMIINISTEGSLNPLQLKKMMFNTIGTTAAADLSAAHLYYTGRNNTFSTEHVYGSTVENPDDSFAISAELSLSEGDNYFWLCYDITYSATAGNVIDAEFVNFTIDDTEYVPAVTSPVGNRMLQNLISMPAGESNSFVVGNPTVFTDDGGTAGNYSNDFEGTLTVSPAEAGKYIKGDFSKFVMQSGSYSDYLEIYNGSNTEEINLIGKYYDTNSPGIIKSTSTDGCLTFKFYANGWTNKEGFEATLSQYEPAPLAYTEGNTTQNKTVFTTSGSEKQEIICVEISVAGESESVNVNSLTFSTDGTTSNGDINAANVFFSGTNSLFSTEEQFGESVTAPQGEFTVSGAQTLTSEGTYYFWLAYDIAAEATAGNVVDAGCLKIIVDDNENIPATTNPDGTREIKEALAGTFTIDAAGNGDYQTFSEALNELKSLGVKGEVTFDIEDGEYEEQLEIGEIPGASETKRIIFRAKNGSDGHVTLKHAAGYVDNFVIRMNGTDFFTFRNLDLLALGASKARVIHLDGGANNNRFINNRIEGIMCDASDTDHNKTLVYSPSLYAEELDNNNEFTGNTFVNGNMALNLGAINAVSDFEEGLIIKDNIFEGQFSKAIYLNYQNNVTIAGNTFTGSSSYNNFYAIDCVYLKKGSVIERNRIAITPQSTGYGICLRPALGTEDERPLVANNFISVQSDDNNSYGLYADKCQYVNFYHNSINMTGNSANSMAFYLYRNTDSCMVKNNILVNTAGGYSLWASGNVTDKANELDFNDYYTSADKFIKWGDDEALDLAAWKELSSHDTSSISIDPEFVSVTDLHVDKEGLKCGTPLAEVTADIDEELRNTTAPYLGADEYNDGSSIEDNSLITETKLLQNYPNPFNPSTIISYQLNQAKSINIAVFNAKGENVWKTGSMRQEAGRYSLKFDGSALNSGIYFYTMEADGRKVAVKKMMMIK